MSAKDHRRVTRETLFCAWLLWGSCESSETLSLVCATAQCVLSSDLGEAVQGRRAHGRSCGGCRLPQAQRLTALSPSCVQREHMMRCYWEQPRPEALRHDPSRPYVEQYRIDARQFAHLFQLVSPWTCGAHTEILAERTFRLLDDNVDQLIEFKAFVGCLGRLGAGG